MQIQERRWASWTPPGPLWGCWAPSERWYHAAGAVLWVLGCELCPSPFSPPPRAPRLHAQGVFPAHQPPPALHPEAGPDPHGELGATGGRWGSGRGSFAQSAVLRAVPWPEPGQCLIPELLPENVLLLPCDSAAAADRTQTLSSPLRVGSPGSVQMFLVVPGGFCAVVSQCPLDEWQVTGEPQRVHPQGQQWSLWGLQCGPRRLKKLRRVSRKQ